MNEAAPQEIPSASIRSIGVVRGTQTQDRPIQRRPSRRRRLLGAGIVSGVIVCAGLLWPAIRGFFSAQRAVPIAAIRIAAVERGRFVSDVSAQGTIVAALSPTLTAAAPGTVSYRVRAGETVKKDQMLAYIDSPELKSEFAREQASLDGLDATLQRESIDLRRKLLEIQKNADTANLQLRAAQREVDRTEAAWALKVIPRRDVDKAHDDLEAARLTQRQAEAGDGLTHESLNLDLRMHRLERDRQRLVVANLKRKLDDLYLRSPVDGVVGTLAVAERGSVQANTPIVTVVDLSVFEVEFAAPDVYAGSLRPGMSAEVAIGAGVAAATVAAVSPEVRQGQVIGRLRFSGKMPADIRQNQRVSLRMILDSRENALKIERGAFVDSGGGRVAYVVRDGQAVRTPIAIGASSVSEVEILSGIAAGERIVVSSLDPFQGAPLVRLIQ